MAGVWATSGDLAAAVGASPASAYTVGARNRESVFHHVLGSGRSHSLGAGIILDGDGRIVHGTAFGKLRIH